MPRPAESPSLTVLRPRVTSATRGRVTRGTARLCRLCADVAADRRSRLPPVCPAGHSLSISGPVSCPSIFKAIAGPGPIQTGAAQMSTEVRGQLSPHVHRLQNSVIARFAKACVIVWREVFAGPRGRACDTLTRFVPRDRRPGGRTPQFGVQCSMPPRWRRPQSSPDPVWIRPSQQFRAVSVPLSGRQWGRS